MSDSISLLLTLKNWGWGGPNNFRSKENMEEIVRAANENERYPIPFQFNTHSLEINLDREQFRSKHFIWATNICVLCTILIFIILIAVCIYFETICHGVGE